LQEPAHDNSALQRAENRCDIERLVHATQANSQTAQRNAGIFASQSNAGAIEIKSRKVCRHKTARTLVCDVSRWYGSG
jgi:hypothetical protein